MAINNKQLMDIQLMDIFPHAVQRQAVSMFRSLNGSNKPPASKLEVNQVTQIKRNAS